MNYKFEKLISNKGNLIDGPLHVYPKIFGDKRGFFYESWNEKEWINILQIDSQKYVSNYPENMGSDQNINGYTAQELPHSDMSLCACSRGFLHKRKKQRKLQPKTSKGKSKGEGTGKRQHRSHNQSHR